MGETVVPLARFLNAVPESPEDTDEGVREVSTKTPSLVCVVTYSLELPEGPPMSVGIM